MYYIELSLSKGHPQSLTVMSKQQALWSHIMMKAGSIASLFESTVQPSIGEYSMEVK